MKIVIDGVQVRAVNLNTAPARAVIALQRELGMGLQQIVDQAAKLSEQAWANKLTEFLSEHNRGRFVTFEELLDRPMAQVILDEDEKRRAKEATADVPSSASTGSPAVDAPEAPAPEAPPRTRRSAGSTPPSRGSKGRSASGS